MVFFIKRMAAPLFYTWSEAGFKLNDKSLIWLVKERSELVKELGLSFQKPPWDLDQWWGVEVMILVGLEEFSGWGLLSWHNYEEHSCHPQPFPDMSNKILIHVAWISVALVLTTGYWPHRGSVARDKVHWQGRPPLDSGWGPWQSGSPSIHTLESAGGLPFFRPVPGPSPWKFWCICLIQKDRPPPIHPHFMG